MNQIQGTEGMSPALVDYSSLPSAQIAAENRQLVQAVRSLSKSGKLALDKDTELTYSLDKMTHRAVVKVVHKETEQVLYQIPPETVLELAREDLGGVEDD